MAKRHAGTRSTKKSGKKPGKSKPHTSARVNKKAEKKKPSSSAAPQALQNRVTVLPEVHERLVITLETIRGDTAIGDLLVTFPRTREILARKGMRLEAENAGDIYMTLDAFSAMNGLEITTLVREIIEVAREPPPQNPSPVIAAVVP